MKPRHIVSTFTASLLSAAIALSASSFAAAQEPAANAPGQSDTTANEPHQGGHDGTAMESECSNAPNNIGQGAGENVRLGNPNAPADIQGSRGQTNPSATRSENAQIAQIEDNCFDEHEDPSNNETVRDQNNPSGVQPEPNQE